MKTVKQFLIILISFSLLLTGFPYELFSYAEEASQATSISSENSEYETEAVKESDENNSGEVKNEDIKVEEASNELKDEKEKTEETTTDVKDEEKSDDTGSEEEIDDISEKESDVVVDENISYVDTLEYKDKKVRIVLSSEKGFVEGTELNVDILKKGTDEYSEYYERTLDVMKDAGYDRISHEQFYDISLVLDGEKVEPDETVKVNVEYFEYQSVNIDELNVVHFVDDENTKIIEDVDIVNQAEELKFETDSFSVYAVVEGVVVSNPSDRNIHVLNEIDGKNLIIYGKLTSIHYMAEGIVNGNQVARAPKNDITGAVYYRFEKIEGTDNQYHIINTNDGLYLNMGPDGGMSYSDTPGLPYYIDYYNSGIDSEFVIYVIGNNNAPQYLNLYSAENGKGIAGWTGKDNGSKMWLLKEESQEEVEVDPYGLNNMTYGIVLDRSDSASPFIAAMQNTWRATGRLNALRVQRKPDPSDSEKSVLVAFNNDVSFWTFHYVDGLNYYISTEIDGETKYLSLGRNMAYLLDEPDETCLFEVQSSEVYEGKYRFVCNGFVLTLNNKSLNNGFAGYTTNTMMSDYDWFSLVEPTQFTDEDFGYRYCAHKISISDEAVTNGTQVVVYTRVWDEDEKKYRFFAIDHDGCLVECSNVGSEIWWQSGPINTLLWDFTEYYYEGTTNPNYYYELQNTYSGKYIAPQLHSGGQLLSDDKIGININGRRYDAYYSKIMAWDDPNYDYAGLVVKDGQLTVVPMAQAGEWYFAIPELDMDSLTTIDTVNNNDYGITMKMKKYTGTTYNPSGSGAHNRNMEQTNVLGNDSEGYYPLVSSYLDSDGYPKALVTGQSLGELFESGQTVNHLFSLEKYRESGYFEYDCIQNYAVLDGSDFKVYNAVGSFDRATTSARHGQFMPYDDLTPGVYSANNFNTEDVLDVELPDTDPRKGMDLYAINRNTANYYFGMEMGANFMQTPSGEDQFGHDLIFEFSGDDDMWLYIDGELVLDLGGIHAAYVGNIDYKTGNVYINRKNQVINTTLRDIFEENYIERNPNASNAEVQAYLDEIFDGNTFKDYSAHEMKMFYMERGAGASNLRMRFNLTTVDEGEALITKNLTGTDKQDYLSVEFPYQAYYRESPDDEWQVFEQGENTDYGYNITYKGGNIPVKTSADNKIFYLKPSQTAELHFSSDDVEYKVVELNVDTEIYDKVYANGSELEGELHDGVYDFMSSGSRLGLRKELVFTNHVDEAAARSLIVTKRLYDENGVLLTKEDDPTTFRFRIYLGKNDIGQYEYYRLGSYHVKDEHNNYCKYVSGQGFVSIGKSSLKFVTEEELPLITFTTSPSGAVDKIPANYSVEITGLLVDTAFKVEEQAGDIPKGYSLDEYVRVSGTYIISEGDTENSGIIRDNSNPHVEVKNSRGWGLTVRKKWTDDTFMASHDTIYVGVYCNGSLVPNTLREYTKDTSSLYWYFDNLISGTTFEDYETREFKVVNPVVNSDGYVTSYDSISVVDEGDVVVLSGKSLIGNDWHDLKYIVDYEYGDITGVNDNLREDDIINVADGLRIVKTDMLGNYISGGTFTLKKSDGTPVGATSYTANESGLITTAYLPEGTYTLSETASPAGYHRLIDDVTIVSDANGSISVSGSDYVSLEEVDGLQEIQIKNRKNEFTAYKMDEALENPLPGTVFALYREIDSNNGKMKDYRPLNGYSNLVVDSDGKIPLVDITLQPGTYYLEERNPITGYIKGDDIKFTVSVDYDITLDAGDATLDVDNSNPNHVEYVMKIRNREYNRLQVRKVNANASIGLENTVFEFYKASDFNTVTNEALSGKSPMASGTTNAQGVISLGAVPNGTYYLKEVTPPRGYQVLPHAVKVVVESDRVIVSGSDMVSVNEVGNIFEIEVRNATSLVIPTGVYGVNIMLVLLFIIFGYVLFRRKKVKG